MFCYESHRLRNGLTVVVCPVKDALTAAVNIMYRVGSVNEVMPKTGIAHLFEHLMFGPSAHVTSYDQALQKAGGDSNAYTSFDVTNYYCSLPACNLEMVFWLESDRMLGPKLTAQAIAIQQKVVIEEFKQTVINQPYGDIWHHLLGQGKDLTAYQWPVIGAKIADIKNLTQADIHQFGQRFYVPNNAVLAVAGGIKPEEVFALSEKWFGTIPSAVTYQETIAAAPPTLAASVYHTIEAKVPFSKMYKAYSMPARQDPSYLVYEALAKLLAGGKGSFLYQELVAKQLLCSSVRAYTLATFAPSFFMLELALNPGSTFEQVEALLEVLFDQAIEQQLTTARIQAAHTQLQADYHVAQMELQPLAEQLALATLLGDTAFFEKELQHLATHDVALLSRTARQLLKKTNITICYQPTRM